MIRDDLDRLQHTERRKLMLAHEYGIPQYVELPNGRFIGVNVGDIKHLRIEERAGSWATGVIKGAQK